MNLSSHTASTRTLVLAVILIPGIILLLRFAQRKQDESGLRISQCEESCREQGYSGYDFKWPILSGPQCQCLGAMDDQ